MATVTTKPAASHRARLASTTTLPVATDRNRLPDAVTTWTKISAPENKIGGVSTTISRSGGLVNHAARAQPSTKKIPARTIAPSPEAARRPTVNTTAIPSTAPRPVSLAAGEVAVAGEVAGEVAVAGEAACPASALSGSTIGVCHEQFGGGAPVVFTSYGGEFWRGQGPAGLLDEPWHLLVGVDDA